MTSEIEQKKMTIEAESGKEKQNWILGTWPQAMHILALCHPLSQDRQDLRGPREGVLGVLALRKATGLMLWACSCPGSTLGLGSQQALSEHNK